MIHVTWMDLRTAMLSERIQTRKSATVPFPVSGLLEGAHGTAGTESRPVVPWRWAGRRRRGAGRGGAEAVRSASAPSEWRWVNR